MAVIVALDAGTTGVRALAVSATGEITGMAQQEFTQHFPQPGWVEHDPEEIWQAACQTLQQLCSELTEPIAALGIANQRETAVAWDRRSGRSDQRAIVWQDRRTAADCTRLKDGQHEPFIRERTGLVADPYFSATKFAWLTQATRIPRSRLCLGTIDAWLLWKLTDGAVFATEPSNASRTMLYDIISHQWSAELCELVGVPLSALPQVQPSSGHFGQTSNTPLPEGTPIAGMAGDQQAALFGQACFAPGEAKNTYGTGSFVLLNIGPGAPGNLLQPGLLTSIGWELASGERSYVLEGSIFITGAVVQWLRDGLQVIDDAAEVENLALGCADTGGCMIVPAFTGLGSPWWEPQARGAIFGLTAQTGAAELARAAIASMSWQTFDVVAQMSRTAKQQLSCLRVDGKAATMDSLLQHQADILDVPVLRPETIETTARGAAWLAGLGVGLWSSLDELSQQWQLDREFLPSGQDHSHEKSLWEQAVERAIAYQPATPPSSG